MRRALESNEVDVNKPNPSGFTPIWVAIAELHKTTETLNSNRVRRLNIILYLLLQNGANTEDGGPSASTTPLIRATCIGFPLIVDLLMEHGADPKKIDKSGHTAIAMAEVKNQSTIKWILTGWDSEKEKTALLFHRKMMRQNGGIDCDHGRPGDLSGIMLDVQREMEGSRDTKSCNNHVNSNAMKKSCEAISNSSKTKQSVEKKKAEKEFLPGLRGMFCSESTASPTKKSKKKEKE